MLGGRPTLDDNLNKALIAITTGAHNDPGFAAGNVFESSVTHEFTPRSRNGFAGSMFKILSEGGGFAVAKIINIPDGKRGVEKIGERVCFVGNIDPIHIPLGNARQEFVTAELGMGNGVT